MNKNIKIKRLNANLKVKNSNLKNLNLGGKAMAKAIELLNYNLSREHRKPTQEEIKLYGDSTRLSDFL